MGGTGARWKLLKEINRDRWCIDTIPAAEARADTVLSTPLIQLPPAEGASVSTTYSQLVRARLVGMEGSTAELT